MAEPTGTGLKSFLIGVLLVLVVGAGWYIFTGGDVPAADEPEMQIDLPDKN